eukprot:2226942-Alexandrium_andersonii.AAC.1
MQTAQDLRGEAARYDSIVALLVVGECLPSQASLQRHKLGIRTFNDLDGRDLSCPPRPKLLLDL